MNDKQDRILFSEMVKKNLAPHSHQSIASLHRSQEESARSTIPTSGDFYVTTQVEQLRSFTTVYG